MVASSAFLLHQYWYLTESPDYDFVTSRSCSHFGLGKPRLPLASLIGGNLVLSINSTFILNQISGQVTEQIDEWDLSQSSPLATTYFWATRLSYSAVEGGKDAAEAVTGVNKLLDKRKDGDDNDEGRR